MDKKQAIDILTAFSYLVKHRNDTVGEMLEALLETNPPKGVVYLLDYGDGLYKIGRTISLERRLKEHGKQGTFQLVCYVPCADDGTRLESVLHNKFASQRVHSEFYRLSQHEVQALITLANRRLFPD